MPVKIPKAIQWHTFHMPIEKDHINTARQILCETHACRRYVGPIGAMSRYQESIHPLPAERSGTVKSGLQVVGVTFVVNFRPRIHPYPIRKNGGLTRADH